jgi:hypothetical protein
MAHRRRRRRSRAPIVLAVLILVAGVGLIGVTAYNKLGFNANGLLDNASQTSSASSPEPPPPPPPPTLQAGTVTAPSPTPKLFAWAFYDRPTGKMSGSANSTKSVNYTESMLKAWLASDYLRRLGTKQPSTSALHYVSTAIRNSNDNSANWLWSQDGRYATLTRLSKLCGLTTVKSDPVYWSQTTMTAQDAVRMGLCVADGTAAGPQWTEYLLEEMRHTQGTTAAKDQEERTGGGHWGIIDGLPKNLQPEVSIKNGWTMHFNDNRWHVNCLALHPDWVLAVQIQIPSNNPQLGQKDSVGLAKAASICASVAEQLTVTPTEASPAPAP